MVYNANVEVIDLKLKEPYILLAYKHMYTVLYMPLPLATVIGSDIEVSFYPYSWVFPVTIVTTTYIKSLQSWHNPKQGVIYIIKSYIPADD